MLAPNWHVVVRLEHEGEKSKYVQKQKKNRHRASCTATVLAVVGKGGFCFFVAEGINGAEMGFPSVTEVILTWP